MTLTVLAFFYYKSQTALSDMNAVWLAELGERRREKEMQLKGMHGGGENTRFGFSIWLLLL